ncbi:hypothetical protein [Lacunimicrobium album]
MLRITACLTLLVLWSADVSAQSRTTSGTGSGTSASSRNSSTGSTSRGTTGGQGSTRGSATGASQGINANAGGADSVSRDFGNDMVGFTDNAGGLVGNAQAGTQSLNMQTPNYQQRNSASRLSSLNSRIKQVDIRGGVRLGFNIEPSAPRTFASAPLPQQVSKLVAAKRVNDSVAVEMYEGGTAILTGTVPNAQKAKLLEMYMMLEPGVRNVENRMVIAAE